MSNQAFWKELILEAYETHSEYPFLDFKESLSEKSERLKEHINAFGNLERGGCFVFGVNNRFEVSGLSQSGDEIITRIAHLARSSQEPALNVDAFGMKIEKKQILCVHVLPSQMKPVFIIDRAPLGGSACFKRTGTSTVPMNVQEIKERLVDAQEVYYDESLVKSSKLTQLDFLKLAAFLPQINTKTPLSPRNKALLQDYKIIDGLKSHPHITVAGWLCFAKNPQSERQFRNAHIEFQLFKGIVRDKPLRKHIIDGNLPDQILQCIELLNKYIWTVPVITGVKREEIPAYSQVVLRELITNSVVHRDYRKMHQPVKIALFDDRIEIENPGSLMPGLTPLNLIHKRDWRNPLIAELMKRFKFGEMDGQGIDRIYSTILEMHVPPPLFINHPNTFTAVLSAPKSFDEFSATEKKDLIIIMAVLKNTINNEMVREQFKISIQHASTLIKTMVANKVLEPAGPSRKYAQYTLTRQYQELIFG